jgi:hypothetical protein
LIRFAVNSGATAPITHDRQEPLQQPVSIEVPGQLGNFLGLDAPDN